MTSHDWNDDGVTDDDVAVPQQDQIAVYTNERGEIVIRQRAWPNDDALILVAPENAERLADAISRCADRLLDGDEEDDDSPAPTQRRRPSGKPAKPLTPAEGSVTISAVTQQCHARKRDTVTRET